MSNDAPKPFVDKQTIALLVNPMGKGLALQDSQLGLLVGAAFGTFYTLSVLGVGWLLDRYSKRIILFFAVFGWSLAAATTGRRSACRSRWWSASRCC